MLLGFALCVRVSAYVCARVCGDVSALMVEESIVRGRCGGLSRPLKSKGWPPLHAHGFLYPPMLNDLGTTRIKTFPTMPRTVGIHSVALPHF
eukprot:1716338-Amphidinium_carterae.1